VLDGYAGAWFYTTNPAFYAGPVAITENMTIDVLANQFANA
jgi:hypothetical protein